MKFLTMEEMAKDVAEKALDEYEYKGKTIRQWIDEIISFENKTSGWISCSERLPKQNERIFATFKSMKGNLIVSEVNFYYDLVHDPLPMIAWMPLPEPYKGE